MSEGMEGEFTIPQIDDGALKEIQDVLGPAPRIGMHWAMVDLYTGLVKYYQRSTKRRSSGGYNRRRRY